MCAIIHLKKKVIMVIKQLEYYYVLNKRKKCDSFISSGKSSATIFRMDFTF